MARTVNVHQTLPLLSGAQPTDVILLPEGELQLVGMSVINATSDDRAPRWAAIQYVDQNGNPYGLASGYIGGNEDRSIGWSGKLAVRRNDTIRLRFSLPNSSTTPAQLSLHAIILPSTEVDE